MASRISLAPKKSHFHINWARLAQFTWLAFAALALGLAFAGLRYRFAELQVICETPRCFDGQTTAELAAALQKVGQRVDAQAARDQAFSVIVYYSIIPIFFSALGAVLIGQKPTNLAAMLSAFLFVALGVILWDTPDSLARAEPVYGLPVRLLHFLTMSGLLVVFGTLPTGRFHRKWLGWLTVVFILASFFFVVIQRVTLDMPIASDNAVFAVLAAIAALTMLASLVLRLRATESEIERQQLQWILAGASLAIAWLGLKHLLYLVAPFAMRGLSSNYISILHIIVVMSFAGCLAVAILQFQLFDIEIIINRGLVYGALTLFIVGAYALIVGGLSVAFARLVPGDDSVVQLLLPLIATSLIVLVFQPLRDRLQRFVNRLMYGERDEPYRVLTRLGERLEMAIEPAAALPLTVETVARALKLPYVAITLKQDSGYQPAAAYGVLQGEVANFPLIYAGETIGELLAARRSPNEPLTAPDQQLLNDLARQIGVSAHAALLSTELEQARLRIVVTQEETRRRLGSDLHDGVGHQLSALLRRAELATLMLERDPIAARDLLAENTQQLNSAISQVRALAHELHPPELELLGLVGALREHAETHSHPLVRLDAPDRLPPLSSAIEMAAYYIALEALTNVSKHASARTCLVRLRLLHGQSALHITMLEMEISDDGCGLPADTAHGLGLLSMRARTAQVGGTCHIESAPNEGTRVSVRLPCPAVLE